ncbi:hypothetical protein DFJ63DRAFT_333503 [Scheffersomyces coipomensis]|uniref:uncharacterized protein n=1 Tax=Scheffersomyces coipomensis TaxID=1788519 RepID=UPI00315C5B01
MVDVSVNNVSSLNIDPTISIRSSASSSESPKDLIKKKSDEDEELYQGRKISKSARLKQMRESQKVLRDERKKKIQNLETENYALSHEVTLLRRAIGYLIPKGSNSDKFYPPSKLPNIYNFDRVVLNGVKRFEGIDEEIVAKFFIEGICIVASTLEALQLCMSTEGCVEESDRLIKGVFRFTPTLELRRLFYDQLVHYVTYKVVPHYWKNSDEHLPNGVMSLFLIVPFIIEYCNYDTISMEALKGFLARCTFATYWGPAIYVSDIILCVAAASDPEFDGDVIIGSLESKLCTSSVGISEYSDASSDKQLVN